MSGTNGEFQDLSQYSSPVIGQTGFISLRSLESPILSRYLFANQFGYNSQFSGLRDLNLILGYDSWINIQMYRYEYERGGIAKRIVEIFPRATWANRFDIVENPSLKRQTPFEKSVEEAKNKLNIHQILIRASILAYLGHYSVILIGAPGDPSTELPRGTSLKNIAYLRPLGEDQAKLESVVGQTDESQQFNPRYGLPEYYQITLGRPSYGGSQVPQIASSFSRRVHWSRVIHVVRNPLDNDIYGEPILRSVWNLLHDLKKLTGGLSEAALRRGWPGLHANIDKDIKFDGGKNSPELKGLKEQLDNYNIGLLNAITTRGVNLGEIATKGAISLKENVDAVMQQIAGTLGVPKRIFDGSERGDLASRQDRTNWSDRVMEERASHNDPMLRSLLGRFVDYGYLPTPRNTDYEIIPPEEEEMSEIEKAGVAKAYKDSGCMTVDEIRDEILGKGPMPKEEMEEEKEQKEEDEEESEGEDAEDDKDSLKAVA